MLIMTEEEKLRQKESALAAKIARLLPNFAKSCREKADAVFIHQDSFAADYQDDEYALLGMAIKFAGLHGKEVHIVGKTGKHSKGPENPNWCDRNMTERLERRHSKPATAAGNALIQPSGTPQSGPAGLEAL